eukprot:8844820-Pyramimonas_sp.AAC.1
MGMIQDLRRTLHRWCRTYCELYGDGARHTRWTVCELYRDGAGDTGNTPLVQELLTGNYVKDGLGPIGNSLGTVKDLVGTQQGWYRTYGGLHRMAQDLLNLYKDGTGLVGDSIGMRRWYWTYLKIYKGGTAPTRNSSQLIYCMEMVQDRLGLFRDGTEPSRNFMKKDVLELYSDGKGPTGNSIRMDVLRTLWGLHRTFCELHRDGTGPAGSSIGMVQDLLETLLRPVRVASRAPSDSRYGSRRSKTASR